MRPRVLVESIRNARFHVLDVLEAQIKKSRSAERNFFN